MSRSYLRAPLRRLASQSTFALCVMSAFGACSGPENTTRGNDTAGSAGQAGAAAGNAGTAGSGASAGGGATGMAGSFNAASGSTGLAGFTNGGGSGTAGSAGSAGSGGSAGSAGSAGSGGSAGSAGTSGSSGSAGSGGSGGTAPEPTGCDTEAGGAAGAGGSGVCAANPIPVKTSWTATAMMSAGGDTPDKAIDAAAGTRFSTGKDQEGDEWLQIDFGVSASISRVEISTTNANDFPAMFEIRVSDTSEDMAATPVASGTGSTAITRCFTPATGRYLLISQTGTGTHWWSVHDVAVSCE